jgi:hypothetical protein
MTYHEQVAVAKRQILELALQRSGGCRSQAARELGLGRTNFLQMLRKHGVTAPYSATLKHSAVGSPGYIRALAEGRVGRPRKVRVPA